MDSLPLRRQQESDQKQRQHAAKAPKLLDEEQQPPASALALFVHEPYGSSSNRLAATATASASAGGGIFPTIPSPAPAAYPRPGSYFSLSQWRELELQALIYKYMVAGASVPLELILPIRRSLLNATARYSSHYQSYPHLQLAMMPTGYWGRSTSDPEPGRCKRTDGKKWRCSREVVAGHKYCERHMHRGRSRSRKHVEVPTRTTTGGTDMMKASSPPSSSLGPGEQRQSSSLLAGAGLTPPLDGLPLTRRHAGDNSIEGSLPQSYYRGFAAAEENGGNHGSGSQILRHFFNDWPSEEQQEPDTTHGHSVGPLASAAKLSVSIPEQPPKFDFSLKLPTGNSEKRGACAEGAPADAVAKQVRASSWSGWVGQNATSMGGPLAEALRLSSSSSASPTSVLQKPNAAVSETTSSVST